MNPSPSLTISFHDCQAGIPCFLKIGNCLSPPIPDAHPLSLRQLIAFHLPSPLLYSRSRLCWRGVPRCQPLTFLFFSFTCPGLDACRLAPPSSRLWRTVPPSSLPRHTSVKAMLSTALVPVPFGNISHTGSLFFPPPSSSLFFFLRGPCYAEILFPVRFPRNPRTYLRAYQFFFFLSGRNRFFLYPFFLERPSRILTSGPSAPFWPPLPTVYVSCHPPYGPPLIDRVNF